MTADRLTERKEAILQAVVEEYMATARPVGSGLVTTQSEIKVSSATVRKELGALEEEGFLHQPHTSAGRVPTDKGYRYFIDSLMSPLSLDATHNERIHEFFSHSHGELERILRDTSRLLAGVTDYAAVVVAPSPDVAEVRSVQLVSLAPRIVLLVAVLSNGGIERRTFELNDDMTEVQVAAAQAALTPVLVEDKAAASPTGDEAVDALVVDAVASMERTDDTLDGRVHVGGRSSVAGVFDETKTVAQVLQLFERQFLVVTLIKDVLDRGLRVAIGAETGVQDLNECSLVVAPYQVEGADAGSIGVLGPTHMNYPQALAAVAVISNHLGDHLTRG
jgi:heat-inducible transcriptional repressor